MSLRKQARILGISHTYLSMLVNGKRKWPEELKARYEELVTTSVTTPKANTSLTKASEDDFTPELVVPRKGLEPSLSYREADFKSAASAIPPPGHGVSFAWYGLLGTVYMLTVAPKLIPEL